MAKKPYHYYAKPRTEQPPRNPSLDTSDIIVQVEPGAPADTTAAHKKLSYDIWSVWHEEDTDPIRRAYIKTGFCGVAFTGFQAAAMFSGQAPEREALIKQKDAVAELAASFKGAHAPLPNTSQAVMDLRTLPEGLACWKKYTNDPADTGNVHGTLIHKCLSDEIDALDQQAGGDLGSLPWMLCIAGSGFVLYRGFAIFWNRIRSHHAACKAIRNNSLYDGEPLPGPLRQKALSKPGL